MTKRFGFTLAEVLITLTIIGVIAAMTVPTLMTNTADQEYKTGLKKAISTLNQAVTMQYALDGTTPSNFTSANIFDANTGIAANLFQKRMQVVSTTSARNTAYAYNKSAGNQAIYLSDGMVIEFPASVAGDAGKTIFCNHGDNKFDGNNQDGCVMSVIVDLNGDKGKCTVATGTETDVTNKTDAARPKDCFTLDIFEDSVRPNGAVGRNIMYN